MYAKTYLHRLPASIVCPPYAYPAVLLHEAYQSPALAAARRAVDVPDASSDDLLLAFVSAQATGRGPLVLPSRYSYDLHLRGDARNGLSGQAHHYASRSRLLNLLPFYFAGDGDGVRGSEMSPRNGAPWSRRDHPLRLEDAVWRPWPRSLALVVDSAYLDDRRCWATSWQFDGDVCFNGVLVMDTTVAATATATYRARDSSGISLR